MSRYKTVMFTSAMLFCFAQSCKSKNAVTDLTWLIGTWENNTTNGKLYETWRRVNENELGAKSYFLGDKKDTILFETVQLIEKDSKLFYIVTGNEKPNEAPVSFESTSTATNKWVFENPGRDFPKVISYTKINADSLVAEISGIQGGKPVQQAFSMKKIK